MAIAKSQQAEHRSVSKKTISDALTSVRRDRENAQNLLELLENDDNFYGKEPQFIEVALGKRNLDGIDTQDILNTLYQTFCEAYTIRLLEEYIRPQQKLYLLLVVFEFLPSYRNLGVRERHEKFVKENPDMRFKKGTKAIAELKDPDSSLSKIEDKEIEQAAAQLEKNIIKNGGRLGFVSAVLDELAERFPEGLPEELPADFLKRIRIEPYSDKIPLQDETSEDDKIKHTELQPNIPTETLGEGTVVNELSSEDSTPKKLIGIQSWFQTWQGILKTRKRIVTALAVVSIIFVIVVIIFVRHIAKLGDSVPPIGELYIRGPEGSEESEYNFTLDAGKGTVINIYGIPDGASIEDLEILIRPKDTDLITVEPIPADIPQVLSLLVRAQEIRIGEVENWQDESKVNVATIVVIYEKTTPVCMNVTVGPDSEEEFSMELSGNGGED